MAIGTVLYKQRMHAWMHSFKLNSTFIPLEQDSLNGGKITFNEQATSIVVKINSVSGVSSPPTLAGRKELQFNL